MTNNPTQIIADYLKFINESKFKSALGYLTERFYQEYPQYRVESPQEETEGPTSSEMLALKRVFEAGELYGRQAMQHTMGRISDSEFTAPNKEAFLEAEDVNARYPDLDVMIESMEKLNVLNLIRKYSASYASKMYPQHQEFIELSKDKDHEVAKNELIKGKDDVKQLADNYYNEEKEKGNLFLLNFGWDKAFFAGYEAKTRGWSNSDLKRAFLDGVQMKTHFPEKFGEFQKDLNEANLYLGSQSGPSVYREF